MNFSTYAYPTRHTQTLWTAQYTSKGGHTAMPTRGTNGFCYNNIAQCNSKKNNLTNPMFCRHKTGETKSPIRETELNSLTQQGNTNKHKQLIS